MKRQLPNEYLAAIEASVLVDGLRPRNERAREAQAARHLLSTIERDKIRIAVPAPAFAEYIASASLDQQEAEAKLFAAKFMILPFDYACAREAGKIQQELMSDGRWKSLKDEFGRPRIKTDLMILACAIVHNAGRLYSSDNGFCGWGGLYIEMVNPMSMMFQVPLDLEIPED